MISPFQLDTAWRDYWNLWGPPSNAQISPIADSKCYLPRMRMVPDTSTQIMSASGKIEYNFVVAPGSIMWAIWAGPSANLPFTFQLTDVAIGHRLFQEPCSTQSLPNSNNAVSSGGQISAANYALLPTPWPVVGDGLFTCEIWGTPLSRYFLILGFAEVNECA
jgi:hypothetical protein